MIEHNKMAHFDSCGHPPIWITPCMPAATVAKELSFRGMSLLNPWNDAGTVGITNYAMLLPSCGSNAIHFTASFLLFIHAVIIS
jgi:hypothetical protein